MNEIKNVLLCGLGGVGCVCASKIEDSTFFNFKVLLDEKRVEKYKNNPTTFNGKEYFFKF